MLGPRTPSPPCREGCRSRTPSFQDEGLVSTNALKKMRVASVASVVRACPRVSRSVVATQGMRNRVSACVRGFGRLLRGAVVVTVASDRRRPARVHENGTSCESSCCRPSRVQGSLAVRALVRSVGASGRVDRRIGSRARTAARQRFPPVRSSRCAEVTTTVEAVKPPAGVRAPSVPGARVSTGRRRSRGSLSSSAPSFRYV